jgi:hypothetical protein
MPFAVREDQRTWRCACGARGTLVVGPIDAAPDADRTFKCPDCGAPLDCRPTRRAFRKAKQSLPDPPWPDTEPLTDAEVERCAEEWKRAQEHVGSLGVMSESHWALDWAERLRAEIRRLRRASG